MERKMLSAEDILGVQDIQFRDVFVPEWNGIVRLRTLTAEEAISYAGDRKRDDFAVQILLRSAVSEDGKPLFTDSDLEKLKKKTLRAIIKLQNVALELNGLAEEKQTTKND